jgi:hypothetical protein
MGCERDYVPPGKIVKNSNRLQSICPFFAMFPAEFVRKHLAFARDGVVFDPFCGRGTTIFEALLLDRPAAGIDINPVAFCISKAKAYPPKCEEVLRRLWELEEAFDGAPNSTAELDHAQFFSQCFSENTLRQILYLRTALQWQSDGVDGFIAALALGALHGESHRSPNYFSNRMPRTISTKPDYSVRWWTDHKLAPPERDVFFILRRLAEYRFVSKSPNITGEVVLGDARNSARFFPQLLGKVTLIITSPPYLDVTDYREDQWLRLWFLGGPSSPQRAQGDDRYRQPEKYWKFLRECWAGLAPLLAERCIIVVRIGGQDADREVIKDQLQNSLEATLTGGDIRLLDRGLTTEIGKGQLQSFNPRKGGIRIEHDFRFGYELRCKVD